MRLCSFNSSLKWKHRDLARSVYSVKKHQIHNSLYLRYTKSRQGTLAPNNPIIQIHVWIAKEKTPWLELGLMERLLVIAKDRAGLSKVRVLHQSGISGYRGNKLSFLNCTGEDDICNINSVHHSNSHWQDGLL